jgi:hypothetical protein
MSKASPKSIHGSDMSAGSPPHTRIAGELNKYKLQFVTLLYTYNVQAGRLYQELNCLLPRRLVAIWRPWRDWHLPITVGQVAQPKPCSDVRFQCPVCSQIQITKHDLQFWTSRRTNGSISFMMAHKHAGCYLKVEVGNNSRH